MMEEERVELKELKKYQNWFSRQINSKSWDAIAERVGDLYINIIERVMNAENPNELNYIIWNQLDFIKDKIKEIRKTL